MRRSMILALFVAAAGLVADPVYGAGEGEGELAKAAQNPIADMISLPFQNNMNFNVGPDEEIQNILNIQPVAPISLNEDWNLITRTIMPVIWQPEFIPGEGRTFGLGDINFTGFFSPANPGKLVWGAGPVIVFPSATDEMLGTGKWSMGPSAVGLFMEGPWVCGLLMNNVWSFAGTDHRGDVNQMLLQYFINYNLRDGWYLVSAPIITANWEANSGNKWTVPIGAGGGKILRVGKLPLNCSVQAFYTPEKPRYGPDWTLRMQVQFLFPKSLFQKNAGNAIDESN